MRQPVQSQPRATSRCIRTTGAMATSPTASIGMDPASMRSWLHSGIDREETMRRLRMAVEKWLAPAPSASLRVTRIDGKADGRNGVRVEVDGPRGCLSLHFFRHSDGAWHVFPPTHASLTMRAGAPVAIND